MLICTPIQLIFEFMCVALQRMKVYNPDSTWEPLQLLLSQITVTTIFTYIIAQSVYYIEIIATDGRPSLYFMTLFFSIVLD